MRAGAGVEAKGEVQAVHMVDDLLHAVGEVVQLALQVARGVAVFVGPAVVEVEVVVPGSMRRAALRLNTGLDSDHMQPWRGSG